MQQMLAKSERDLDAAKKALESEKGEVEDDRSAVQEKEESVRCSLLELETSRHELEASQQRADDVLEAQSIELENLKEKFNDTQCSETKRLADWAKNLDLRDRQLLQEERRLAKRAELTGQLEQHVTRLREGHRDIIKTLCKSINDSVGSSIKDSVGESIQQTNVDELLREKLSEPLDSAIPSCRCLRKSQSVSRISASD